MKQIHVGKNGTAYSIGAIILLVAIWVTVSSALEPKSSKGSCKCRFFYAADKFEYYENQCKRGYRPSFNLYKLPNYPNSFIIRLLCKCKCKEKKINRWAAVAAEVNLLWVIYCYNWIWRNRLWRKREIHLLIFGNFAVEIWSEGK